MFLKIVLFSAGIEITFIPANGSSDSSPAHAVITPVRIPRALAVNAE
jgi:hypothetical protein